MANGHRPICRPPRPPSIDANAHGALFSALGLASMPGFARRAGRQPLPEGVLEVIKIAAGCEETLRDAAALSGRDPDAVKAAAEFYLRHALLFDGADSRRILGVSADADRDEMRLHLRWLMIWLHPDHAQHADRSALAGRVLEAWREHASAPQPILAQFAEAASGASSRLPAPKDAAGRWIRTALLVSLAIVVIILFFDLGADETAFRTPMSLEEAAGGFQ